MQYLYSRWNDVINYQMDLNVFRRIQTIIEVIKKQKYVKW